MNYLLSDSIIFSQFKELMKKDPANFEVTSIAPYIYIFEHGPTKIAFYVIDDFEQKTYSILLFKRGQTFELGEVEYGDELYASIDMQVSLKNLGDVLDAEFKLGDYLTKL